MESKESISNPRSYGQRLESEWDSWVRKRQPGPDSEGPGAPLQCLVTLLRVGSGGILPGVESIPLQDTATSRIPSLGMRN